MLAAGSGISAWISAICPRPHASCCCAAVSLVMELLREGEFREEEFVKKKAAVHLLVYTARGHPRETLERDKTGAFTSLNNCSIKYWWIYKIVDGADDSTNPFVNEFQSFSRSVVLSAGCQAFILSLVTLRVPDVNHLFINTLLDPCIENILRTLTVEHENMHQLQKRHHQRTAETPFIWKSILWLFLCNAKRWVTALALLSHSFHGVFSWAFPQPLKIKHDSLFPWRIWELLVLSLPWAFHFHPRHSCFEDSRRSFF